MKQLTKEQKNENVTKLINYVNDYFSVERVEKVKELFRLYYNRILNDPASSRGYYHSCYNGGWLIHTINVIDCALKLSKLWCAANIAPSQIGPSLISPSPTNT